MTKGSGRARPAANAASSTADKPRPVAPKAAPEPDDPSVKRYLAAFIMGIANRLGNGASNHYRKHFDLGMSEWRAMMALGVQDELIVRQVAELADLDQAAASKSVRLLEARGLVDVEQTSRRGRAAIVRLTPLGRDTYARLRVAAERRQQQLVAAFTPEELATLWALLKRVEQQVPAMNAE
jgi:DNA-binding MarR family transcriptional regulator